MDQKGENGLIAGDGLEFGGGSRGHILKAVPPQGAGTFKTLS
jgi:hypothetical protein